MTLRPSSLAPLLVALAGCGGFFDSKLPAQQTYVLRLAPLAPAATAASFGSVRVQRPEAGPGLDSERIALLRSGQRFDFYAATRWATAAPDLVESAMVDSLRGSGAFAAVFDDTAPYAPDYNLRCGLRRFESDYTQGGRVPTVHVALDCSLGRNRDRALLANFTAAGSAAANDDRLSDVVAAFEAATASAFAELAREMRDALAAESAEARK